MEKPGLKDRGKNVRPTIFPFFRSKGFLFYVGSNPKTDYLPTAIKWMQADPLLLTKNLKLLLSGSLPPRTSVKKSETSSDGSCGWRHCRKCSEVY